MWWSSWTRLSSRLSLVTVNISLFRQLLIQTQMLAARYRTGDGTGVAGVTPATSCVQDSNQALFIAIQQVKRQIEPNPQMAEWIQQNPDSPEAIGLNGLPPWVPPWRNALPPTGWCAPTGKIMPNPWPALPPGEHLPAIKACSVVP
jgi:hypothetical protein